MDNELTITEKSDFDETCDGRYVMGKRTKVICGKVSQTLYDEVKSMIDGKQYKTMNDVVETAVWHYVMLSKKEGTEGGTSLGN